MHVSLRYIKVPLSCSLWSNISSDNLTDRNSQRQNETPSLTTSMSSVNDVCKHLGIRHPMEQPTCIGYGQRKPTCGNAVAESSRSQAIARLERVRENLDSGRRANSDSLLDIASLLLCGRYHQYQAEENAQRWKRSLRGYFTPRRQATPIAASSGVAPARNVPVPEAVPSPGPMLQSCSNLELIREVRRRLGRAGRVELLHELIQITTAVSENRVAVSNQAHSNTSRENPRVDVEVSRPDPPGSSITAPPAHSGTAGNANRTSTSVLSQHRSAGADTMMPAARSPTPESMLAVGIIQPASDTLERSVVASPRPDPPVRAPSPLRQSHTECVVCILSYEEDPEDYWECRRCLNRVHLSCFETWMASQLPAQVTCIHCRGRILEGRTV